MPYVKNKGVRVRYEVEGNGSPLVLLQGLTGYLELWHELGYVDSLKKDYKLILMTSTDTEAATNLMIQKLTS